MKEKFKELVFILNKNAVVEEPDYHFSNEAVTRIPVTEGLDLHLALTKEGKIEVNLIRVRFKHLGQTIWGDNPNTPFTTSNLSASRSNEALRNAINRYMETNKESIGEFQGQIENTKEYWSRKIRRLARQEWCLNLDVTPDEELLGKYPEQTVRKIVETRRRIKEGPTMYLGGLNNHHTMILEQLPSKLVRKIVYLIEQEYGEAK